MAALCRLIFSGQNIEYQNDKDIHFLTNTFVSISQQLCLIVYLVNKVLFIHYTVNFMAWRWCAAKLFFNKVLPFLTWSID